MTKIELALSKAPVGSSASMTLGLLINALKMAILSFSPPLKSAHLLLNNSLLIEKSFNNLIASSLAVFSEIPLIKQGAMTLYKTVWSSNK